MSACCMCCVAADERGEPSHEVGTDCPYPPCDYCQGCICPIWEADDYYGWQACPLHGPVVS